LDGLLPVGIYRKGRAQSNRPQETCNYLCSEGFITVYPSLHENKEKGKLRRILKKLIQLRKGH
jgi:hypothetical protein